MTFQQEVAALGVRIAAAQAERDGWRASGMQEKYLEAYSTVEALELQLEGVRQEGLRITVRGEHSVQRLSRPAAKPALPRPREPQGLEPSQRELMAELAITLHDDGYHLGPYRYTILDDAVNYARLLRAQGREREVD